MKRTKDEIEADMRRRLEDKIYVGMTTQGCVYAAVHTLFEVASEILADVVDTTTQKAEDRT